MPEVKKFELEKISAAQKLLRAMPVKDTSKSLNETLLMLSGGIQAALDKGYSRRAIRNKLAEAGVVISTTSLNNFLHEAQRSLLPENPKGTSGKQESKNVSTPAGPQVNTKGTGDAQQTVVSENSKESAQKTGTVKNTGTV
jgi:hypothetical protein